MEPKEIKKIWDAIVNEEISEEFVREQDLYSQSVFSLKQEDGFRNFSI